MTRATWHLRAILLIACVLLSGCLEFLSIEQPASIRPGEAFTVRIAATTESGDAQPYLGVCLPRGWTIPGDTVACTGVYRGTIHCDPRLALEQESLSPAPEGYYWWVGIGDGANTPDGDVFAEIPIQAGLQTGRYSLDYLLAATYGLPNAERSDNHIVDVVNEFTPRGLHAIAQGNSVVLTWLPPTASDGLAGYRVYRDGRLIYAGPAQTTQIFDENLAAGMSYRYSASAVYGAADEHLTPYEVKAQVFSGGAGEPNDPYQIATAVDLLALGETSEDYDKHFILTADIDLDPNLPGRKVFDKAVIAPDTDPGDEHGQFQGTAFTGVFDGNGHTIRNLRITGAKYVGLFGRLGPTASLSNLGLEAIDVSGTEHSGGLAGYNRQGSIVAVHSSGSIRGTNAVGGLVGTNQGYITTCHAAGMVTGTGDMEDAGVGGLVGGNTGPVWGPGGSIVASYSTSSVSGVNAIGGLAGSNGEWARITNSYSTGSVSGTDNVGGLVGHNIGPLVGPGGSIVASYSSGSVSGSSFVGGLVGFNNAGGIAASYSRGLVSGTANVGGLVGYGWGSTRSSLWDVQTSGQSRSAAGAGLTTAEMMDPQMLGLNGFANDPNWVLDRGCDYPRLAWEGSPGGLIPEAHMDWLEGQGTAQSPYRIDTAEQLILVSKASILWDEHLVLGADLDLDPILPGRRIFGQAVFPVFTGEFDGQGHVISHLMIEGGQNLGLFGYLTGEAKVRNVGVVEANITGSYQVGGLVGENMLGSIAACYSTGAVAGTSHVGGLVGQSWNGSISSSYSLGSVRGNRGVGGLVGSNRSSIHVSYSSALVIGTDGVGGLVGYNENAMGGITSCFWDVQTSGRTTGAGGIGKTTAEMQRAKTFLDAGWDFVDEAANGTEDIWWIDEGKGYPHLWWESSQDSMVP